MSSGIPPSAPRWSHVGICVRDLDAALAFYCDGLGGRPAARYELGSTALPGLAEALEVRPPVSVVSHMVEWDALRVELLGWVEPGVAGTPSSARNHLGLTHLSFWVADLETTVASLVRQGGTLLPDTRRSPGIDLVFIADPDGTRIELMASPPSA